MSPQVYTVLTLLKDTLERKPLHKGHKFVTVSMYCIAQWCNISRLDLSSWTIRIKCGFEIINDCFQQPM